MALTDKLSKIADAIRSKTGKADLLTLDQMPTEIASIETGGGGGSVETCTVQLVDVSDIEVPVFGLPTPVFFTNPSSVVEQGTMSGMDWNIGKTFEVAKGTIFIADDENYWGTIGSVERISFDSSGTASLGCFIVYGDCTIQRGL